MPIWSLKLIKKTKSLEIELLCKKEFLPSENDKGIKTGRDAVISTDTLRGIKQGILLDQAFLAKTIELHESSIWMLDHKYIPNAKNFKFKEYLIATRAHVAEHLARAIEIKMQYNL